MSHTAIVDRFVRDAGTDSPRFLRPRSANIIVSPDGRSLYSYGSHFTLVRLMPATATGWRRDESIPFHAPNGWWLVNGDTFSISTSRHQSIIRAAIREDGRPSMIVSFSAMRSAGIELDTIAPVEALGDREIPVTRTGPELPDEVRREYVRRDIPEDCDAEGCGGFGSYTFNGQQVTEPCHHRYARGVAVYRETPERWTYDETARLYRWTDRRHVLGESVFSANVRTTVRDSEGRSVAMSYAASFLSAFDHQETHLHYFLAELPAGAHPYGFDTLRVRSVADAFRALRPAEVLRADETGVSVVRQGDMFAIPRPDVTTAALRANGYTFSQGMGRIGGGSHLATRTATHPQTGRTYARGILHHRPLGWRNPGEDPNHRRQTLGDRDTWHLMVRNTVPRATVGNQGDGTDVRPRSWTRGGSVD